MNIPHPEQVVWLTMQMQKLGEECKANLIDPVVFLYVLQASAENAYMDKVAYMSQEEWDSVVQMAKDEMHIANKVGKGELTFEEGAAEVRKLKMR